MADHTIDVKGLNCPLPIMQAKKTMKGLQHGETLEVFATDPGSIRDFESFCRSTGNTLVEQSEVDEVYRFLLIKNIR